MDLQAIAASAGTVVIAALIRYFRSIGKTKDRQGPQPRGKVPPT